MNHLPKFLAIGSIAILSAVVAALLYMGALSGIRVDGVAALLLGFCLFLTGIHVQGRIEAGSEITALRRLTGELSMAQMELRAGSDRLAREIGDIGNALDALGGISNRDVVNEMRVLEGLLQRLSAGRQALAPMPIDGAATVLVQNGNALPPLLLGELNEALEDNRIDLYLQPVVSLPQRKIRSYEAYSRLRDAAGAIIEPGKYIGVAEAAGVVSTIDNLLLLRCVQLIRRLHHRNRSAVIFCNISAHSLRDDKFFPQFVNFMEQNPDLAGSLIFEFSQATVEENTALEWRQLARLAAQGYRLSMDNVTHLDLDLEALAGRRFGYIKVPAQTLLNGMAEARSKFLSSDIKAALRRYGIDLIAEKIEDENTVLGLLDFELDFGQGFLFGEPRRSRGPDELRAGQATLSDLTPPRAAAAALRASG